MGPSGASIAGDQSGAASPAEENLENSQSAAPAEGQQEPDGAPDQPIQIVPHITVAHPESGGASEQAAAADSLDLEGEGFDNEGFAYPETHFCIKESKILVYYLYEPGTHEGWLCELRFSHIPAHWHATAERNFCAAKLASHLRRAKSSGFACYCSRPGKPAVETQITDSGHSCEESASARAVSKAAKEAIQAAVAAPARQRREHEGGSSSGPGHEEAAAESASLLDPS